MTGAAGPPAPGRSQVVGQAIRFALVGGMNTVIDFGIFSVLRAISVPLIAANLVSTSCGMAVSFFANRKFVFSSTGDRKRQAVLFVLCTAFSLYVLQSVVILGVTRYAPGLLDQAVRLAALAGLRSEQWSIVVRSNAAKVVATFFSLTWNFVFYRLAVFKDPAS